MIEHLPAEAFSPQMCIFVDRDKSLHALYERLAFKSNLLLVGAKGTGKSLSIQSFAYKINCPIITFDCSEDVRRSHLLGMFVLRGQETPYVLGPLTTAFEIANQVGRCILVLEEINALSPQMQKVLNSTLDFRRKIVVPEAGKVFSLEPTAQLWVTGTMNHTVYGGTYELNEDLKSRVRLLSIGYPSLSEETKILTEIFKSSVIPPEVVQRMLTLAHETRQRSLEYALSTRDLVQVLEDFVLVGPEKALWILLGKFEGDDRTTVIERICSIFGINLETE